MFILDKISVSQDPHWQVGVTLISDPGISNTLLSLFFHYAMPSLRVHTNFNRELVGFISESSQEYICTSVSDQILAQHKILDAGKKGWRRGGLMVSSELDAIKLHFVYGDPMN